MIRGILSGGAAGLVTVAVGLSVASLLAPQPAGNTPPLPPQVDAPADVVPLAEGGPAPDVPIDSGADDAAVEAATLTPQVSAPAPAPGPVLADTTSADLPETGIPADTMTAPDPLDTAEAALNSSGTEAPVLPNAPSVAPQVPVPEGDLSLSTDPAIPTPVPVVVPEVVPEIVPEIVPEPAPAIAAAQAPAPEDVADLPDDPVAVPTEAAAPEVFAAEIAEAPETTPLVRPIEVDAPEPSDMDAEMSNAPTEVPAAAALPAEALPAAALPAAALPAAALPAANAAPVATGPTVIEDATTALADPMPETPDSAQTVAQSGAIKPAVIQPEIIAPAPDSSVATMLDMVDVTPVDPSERDTDAFDTFDADPPKADAPDADAPDADAPDAGAAEPETPDADAFEPLAPDAATPDRDAPASEDPALPAVMAHQSDAAALPTTDNGVRINRIGTEDPVPDADAPPEAAPDPGDLLPEPDGPALVRYAALFENPDAKPLLSIILIDDGSLANAAIALGSLPFPVTVAIDPATTNATTLMDTYRAAGIEVLALARLPQGARPADVEVTFESVFATLPEAIGVLDAGAGGLQADSGVTDQAMARFAADGRGVVTLDAGLNMAMRAAAAAGVPAGTIARDLDGDGQDATVIRRFLDDAAFRARQGSGVILLGRVRADTLSALNLWGGQNRTGQVAVAPVSAVLLAAE